MNDVTRILSAIEQGEAQAAGHLLPLVYEELRRLACTDLGCLDTPFRVIAGLPKRHAMARLTPRLDWRRSQIPARPDEDSAWPCDVGERGWPRRRLPGDHVGSAGFTGRTGRPDARVEEQRVTTQGRIPISLLNRGSRFQFAQVISRRLG